MADGSFRDLISRPADHRKSKPRRSSSVYVRPPSAREGGGGDGGSASGGGGVVYGARKPPGHKRRNPYAQYRDAAASASGGSPAERDGGRSPSPSPPPRGGGAPALPAPVLGAGGTGSKLAQGRRAEGPGTGDAAGVGVDSARRSGGGGGGGVPPSVLQREQLELLMNRLKQLATRLESEQSRRVKAEDQLADLTRQLHETRQRESDLSQRLFVAEGVLAKGGPVQVVHEDGKRPGEGSSEASNGPAMHASSLEGTGDHLQKVHEALRQREEELAQLRNDNRELAARLSNASLSAGTDSAAARATVQQAIVDSDRSKSELALVKAQLEAEVAEKQALAQRLELAQSTVRAVGDEAATKSREVSSQGTRLKGRISALENELDDEIAAKEDAMAESRRNLETVRATLRKLAVTEQRLRTAQVDAERAADDRRALAERLDALRARNDRLEKTARTASKKVGRAGKDLKQVEELRQANANLQRECESLKRKAASFRETEARLHAQLEAQRGMSPKLRGLEERSQALQEIATTATDRVDALETELELARTETSQLRSSLADANFSLQRSKIQLEGASGEAEQLRSVRQHDEDTAQTLQRRIKQDAARIAELSQKVSNLESERVRLITEIEEAKSTSSAAVRRLNDVASEVEEADMRVQAATAEADRQRAHARSLSIVLEKAEARCRALLDDNAELREVAARSSGTERLRVELVSTKEEAAALNDEKEAAAAEAKAAADAARASEERVSELEEKVERLTRENDLLVRLSSGVGDDVTVALDTIIPQPHSASKTPRSSNRNGTPASGKKGKRSPVGHSSAAPSRDSPKSRRSEKKKSPAGERDVKELIRMYEGRGTESGRRSAGSRHARTPTPEPEPDAADADTSVEMDNDFRHSPSGSPAPTGPSLNDVRDGGFKVDDMRAFIGAERQRRDVSAGGVEPPRDDGWGVAGLGLQRGDLDHDSSAVQDSDHAATPEPRGSEAPVASTSHPISKLRQKEAASAAVESPSLTRGLSARQLRARGVDWLDSDDSDDETETVD